VGIPDTEEEHLSMVKDITGGNGKSASSRNGFQLQR
jgi:hypothetical protein